MLKHIRLNFLSFSPLIWFWIFTHTKQRRHKSKINNKNNAYKEMQDAQMHDYEASNALRVLQKSK